MLRCASRILLFCLLVLPVVRPLVAQLSPWTFGVRTWVMDEETPPNFYIGNGEGLFRSTDEMVTWTPIYTDTPGLPQPAVRQIFIDPDQSARIYLWTVRGNSSGILRSDDRGETWMSIKQGLPENAEILRLFPDLNNSSRFYAYLVNGSASAVYKTTNRGDTWSLRATLPGNAKNMDIQLAMPTLWYCITAGTIHRSMDEGQSWSGLSHPPVELTLGNSFSFVRTDPQVPNNVYVGQIGPSPTANGAYRSTNQGASWTKILDESHQDLVADDYSTLIYIRDDPFPDAIVSRNRGLTFDHPPNVPGLSAVEGSPVNLLVDRRNLSTVYTEPFGVGLFISTDGADSWEPLNSMYSPTIGAQNLPPDYPVTTLDLSPFTHTVEVVVVEDNELGIDFTVAPASEAWVSAAVNAGTTPFSLNIMVNPSSLGIGMHTATLTVASAATENGSFDIPVVVVVTENLPPGSVPTILTLAGGGFLRELEEDIPAIEANFRFVQSVAVGPDGSLYISDRFDQRIRRKSPNPLLSTVAGSGVSGFVGDGGPAVAAQFNFPSNVAVGSDDTLYVVDDFNYRVRQVSPDGTITTFAGNGEFGTPSTAGIAVEQPIPADSVAVDGSGVVFIGARSRVLRVVNGGYTTMATLVGSTPEGLAVDGAGNVYVAEVNKNRVSLIRPNRTVEEFAGTGDTGFTGDGGPATAAMLNGPEAVAVDAAGNVYIADTDNHVIRKVDTAGNISTYAGTGLAGFRGDGGPAAQAQLEEPTGVAVGQDGILYIADSGNSRVRAVMPTGVLLAQIARDGIVNAASFVSGAISPGSIITMFGLFLAEEDGTSKGAGLPSELGGTTVEIVDSTGTARPVGIFGIFRDQAQMNLYVDPETALGPALVRLTRENGQVTVASIDVNAVAPGIFYVPNGSGQNVALAQYLRVSGGQVGPLTLTFSAADFSLTPIDLGPEGDQIFVVLYGTGIRGAGTVTATINGVEVPVSGFAAAAGFFGLDQANIGPIPRSFIDAGPVEVVLSVDGVVANVVMVSFL